MAQQLVTGSVKLCQTALKKVLQKGLHWLLANLTRLVSALKCQGRLADNHRCRQQPIRKR